MIEFRKNHSSLRIDNFEEAGKVNAHGQDLCIQIFSGDWTEGFDDGVLVFVLQVLHLHQSKQQIHKAFDRGRATTGYHLQEIKTDGDRSGIADAGNKLVKQFVNIVT